MYIRALLYQKGYSIVEIISIECILLLNIPYLFEFYHDCDPRALKDIIFYYIVTYIQLRLLPLLIHIVLCYYALL